MATATDYLPVAIGNYLRLPRDWADTRPIAAGKSSVMLLVDQLDLLGATMDKVADAINRSDAEAIIVHGAFLEEKFGHASAGGSLGLGLPDPTPGPGSSPDHRPAGPSGVTRDVPTEPQGAVRDDALLSPRSPRASTQLIDVAAEAGLDPAAARDEGLRVAAALAESVPGAAHELGRASPYPRPDRPRDASTRPSSTRPREGRRWRAPRPTCSRPSSRRHHASPGSTPRR